MRIGIDSRMYGPQVGGGGLGRYVEQLVSQLSMVDHKNRYVLFLKEANINAGPINNQRFEKRLANAHWYTLKEQRLASVFDQERLDLMHFPHWNVPLFLRTPFVVTIHDLILLQEPRSARATTRHPLIYCLKYAGFRCILRHAIEKSRHIIAVSEFTKKSIKNFFPKTPDNKITVIYEGVTALPHSPTHPLTHSLLYVGNAYPHKNLPILLQAFATLRARYPDITLTLAGQADVFYERLGRPPGVNVIGNPTDAQLANLYQHATIYVLPSRIEGFGLGALEAMASDVPVVAARAGALPEVLGTAAAYFSPDNQAELAQVIEQLLNDEAARREITARGRERIKLYSWRTMAERTLGVYEKNT